jgi:hypothetical protein
MHMTDVEVEFAAIKPSERILLMSHCLRPSQTCSAKYNKRGLICIDDCKEPCVIGRLRKIALTLNYKGVCIAPGGSLAIKYVKEFEPEGIVAIACNKELEEGIEAVGQLDNNKKIPVIVTVPLTRDGCVDTEVDEALALHAIRIGCDDINMNNRANRV